MQDRSLQQAIEDQVGSSAILSLLAKDPSVGEPYRKYLNFVTRLTNPFPPDIPHFNPFPNAFKDVDVILEPDKIHFFPPSRSHEVELVKKLFGDKEIPEGFNLIDEMIKRVRAKEISLSPTEISGWYDYQVWSFLPLRAPPLGAKRVTAKKQRHSAHS